MCSAPLVLRYAWKRKAERKSKKLPPFKFTVRTPCPHLRSNANLTALTRPASSTTDNHFRCRDKVSHSCNYQHPRSINHASSTMFTAILPIIKKNHSSLLHKSIRRKYIDNQSMRPTRLTLQFAK